MTASTGRQDYDQTVKLSTLQPGEPIFILRGSDKLASDTVRAWAGLAHRENVPAEAVEMALQQADRMDAWPGKKVPDGPELSEAARKQLRYEHSRRAWNARAAVETDAGALAAQVGRDAVLGELRNALAELSPALAAMEIDPAGDAFAALQRVYAIVGQDLFSRIHEARR